MYAVNVQRSATAPEVMVAVVAAKAHWNIHMPYLGRPTDVSVGSACAWVWLRACAWASA